MNHIKIPAHDESGLPYAAIVITPTLAAQIVALAGECRARQMSDTGSTFTVQKPCSYCGALVTWGRLGPVEYHDCKGGTLKAPLNAMENAAAGETPVGPFTIEHMGRMASDIAAKDAALASRHLQVKQLHGEIAALRARIAAERKDNK